MARKKFFVEDPNVFPVIDNILIIWRPGVSRNIDT
jgi:hypothetical protein